MKIAFATAVMAGVITLGGAAAPAVAQGVGTYGACCLPNDMCGIMSTVKCALSGGRYAGSGSCNMCSPQLCSDIWSEGPAMSRVAAERLINQGGVVHCVETSFNVVNLYQNTAFWDQVWGDSCGSSCTPVRAIVAPMIHMDLLQMSYDPSFSPEWCASELLDKAVAAQAAFNTANNSGLMSSDPDYKPFYWSVRCAAFGGWYHHASDGIPVFTNHLDDCPAGILDSDHVVTPLMRGELSLTSSTGTTVTPTGGAWLSAVQRLGATYFTSPEPVKIYIENPLGGAALVRYFASVSDMTGTITLDASVPALPAGTDFSLERLPEACFFYEEGGDECQAWIEAFVAEVDDLMTNDPTYTDLPAPKAFVITTEDTYGTVESLFGSECTMSQLSAYEVNRADARATDTSGENTIDGVRNLEDWEAERFSIMELNGDLDPNGVPNCMTNYDPNNFDAVSYVMATRMTAYAYHRERSTWSVLRDIWPDALMPQYQISPGGSPEFPVMIWPGEAAYHGDPLAWFGSATWDEYYHLIDLIPSASVVATATAEPDSGSTTQIIVSMASPDPFAGYSYNSANEDRIEFIGSGEPLAHVGMFKVTGWNSMTRVLTLESAMPQAPDSGDTFRLYRGNYHYHTRVYDSTTNSPAYYPNYTGLPKWRLLWSYAQRANQPINAAGFEQIMKGWAAEQARQYSLSYPNNPLCVFYSAGHGGTYSPAGSSGQAGYDGIDEFVPGEYTYPAPGFAMKDGFLDAEDWGEIGTRAMNYGVNNIVWFQTDEDVEVMGEAIHIIQENYDQTVSVYEQIRDAACPADFNGVGGVTVQDIFDFLAAYFGCYMTADVDDNGSLGVQDIFSFLETYFSGCP